MSLVKVGNQQTSALRLPNHGNIGRKGERIAKDCLRKIRRGGYSAVIPILEQNCIDEPVARDGNLMGKIARVCCPEWWRHRLLRQAECEYEHFAIRSRYVNRSVSPYVSKIMLSYLNAKQIASAKAVERLEAINLETQQKLDMSIILKGSQSNPEVRLVELMVRCKGFANYAKEQGHLSVFYTLTAPSKYHPMSFNSEVKKSYPNPKYQGFSPRDTQDYLVSIWKKIRSKLNREGLKPYGFRVVEPHHDGTPHWHLLLFMSPRLEAKVTKILKHYALAEDGDEKGADTHRLIVKTMDPSKGSAAGYLAKHISKNISGKGISKDYESGLSGSDGSDRVRKWASVWRIRQFQMTGGASVGVWRELRRLDTCPDGILKEAFEAANSGNWGKYLALQGGPDVNRKDQKLKCYWVNRKDKKSGRPQTNKYGEILYKIEGVVTIFGDSVKTRFEEWTIKVKQSSRSIVSSSKELIRSGGAFSVVEVPMLSRSIVNNCTPSLLKEQSLYANLFHQATPFR